MPKPVILVADQVANSHFPSVARPRQDYEELARKLGADICCNRPLNHPFYKIIRKIDKHIKLDLLAASQVARHINEYELLLSLSEKLAIPTAAFLSLLRKDTPHFVIAHKLSSGYKKSLFKLWHLQHNFHHVITISQAQTEYAIHHLGLAPGQVHPIFDKVDHHFFKPQRTPLEDFIFAVGLEQRDYQTLISATKTTGIQLVILANSRWSSYKNRLPKAENATYLTKHVPFQELRDLYAQAKLVVLPLENVDYAAGVNSALEAMAMGKPLIASQTTGIAEYLRHGETTWGVEPGNIPALRDAILSLWHRPQEQRRLGCNARQLVEEQMNLDIYVNNVVDIVQKETKEVHKLKAPTYLERKQ